MRALTRCFVAKCARAVTDRREWSSVDLTGVDDDDLGGLYCAYTDGKPHYNAAGEFVNGSWTMRGYIPGTLQTWEMPFSDISEKERDFIGSKGCGTPGGDLSGSACRYGALDEHYAEMGLYGNGWYKSTTLTGDAELALQFASALLGGVEVHPPYPQNDAVEGAAFARFGCIHDARWLLVRLHAITPAHGPRCHRTPWAATPSRRPWAQGK